MALIDGIKLPEEQHLPSSPAGLNVLRTLNPNVPITITAGNNVTFGDQWLTGDKDALWNAAGKAKAVGVTLRLSSAIDHTIGILYKDVDQIIGTGMGTTVLANSTDNVSIGKADLIDSKFAINVANNGASSVDIIQIRLTLWGY